MEEKIPSIPQKTAPKGDVDDLIFPTTPQNVVSDR